MAALEKAGKPHRYIEQPDGDLFLSNKALRILFFEAMDGFLKAHIGRGPIRYRVPLAYWQIVAFSFTVTR